MKAGKYFLLLAVLLISLFFSVQLVRAAEEERSYANWAEMSQTLSGGGASLCDEGAPIYCECTLRYFKQENVPTSGRVTAKIKYCSKQSFVLKLRDDQFGSGLFRVDYDPEKWSCKGEVVLGIFPKNGGGISCAMVKPDACLCHPNMNVQRDPRLIVDKNLHVLVEEAEVGNDFLISSGRVVDMSSPKFNAAAATFEGGTLAAFLSGYPDFLSGSACVLPKTVSIADITSRPWDCSTPVFFKGGRKVCCCEGSKCTQKDVMSANLTVCGPSEQQTPVPASGECAVNIQNAATIQGIDVDVLRQKARSALNPLNFSSPENFLGRMLKGMMANIGVIALAMYVWAGFLWMTAQGSAEKTEKAKQVLIWTSLGLVVMLSAYILVKFVFTSLGL